MKTTKSLGYASASTLAIALLAAPSMSIAETGGAATSSHSLVHKVSHSLADSQSYTSGGNAGYKWGRKAEQTQTNAEWAMEDASRSGYKWGNSDNGQPAAHSYADSTTYTWGVRNYADQSGYKWGIKNYADQSGYKWGIKNYADQSGYKWGIKNYAEQWG
jgi:hypothetical protein